MERFIDLHIHSIHSDGLFSPKEIVNYAAKRNLAAIALADHDTTSGIPEAIAEGEKTNIENVPAVELSIELDGSIGNISSIKNKEIHILGYYIDWKNALLQEKLYFFRQKRKERARLIYEKFQGLGIELDPAILESIAKEERSFGRMHFARALVKEGHVANIYEAFQLYLDYGKPAFVEKVCFKPKEAIELITNLGGIAILAHPYFSSPEEIITPLVSFGLKGIEVWHSRHSSTQNQRLISLAKKEGLLMTGGSDFHGETDKEMSLLGSLKIPYRVLEEMKECLPKSPSLS